MSEGLWLVGGLVALALLLLFQRWRSGRPRFLAHAEYWVYVPGSEMPVQDLVMTRMVAQNPHARAGVSPIGTAEGILFSDIRVHTALVLRKKNPHVFRPDLFGDDVEFSPEVLPALAQSQSLVKVRFLSEEPLADDRHLRFLPHLADAYAQIGQAVAVYDTVQERLFLRSEFYRLLAQFFDCAQFEAQVRVVWREELKVAQTKGMAKRGLPELQSAPVAADQRQLIQEVLTEVARGSWVNEPVDSLELYGDRFEILRSEPKANLQIVHVRRHQVRP